jgi:hypothetical protein
LISLFIPLWLLISLPSYESTTIPKGVSLTLRVAAISNSNEIGTHDRLDTWTRRFRRTSDVKLRDMDDLRRLVPQSMGLKCLFHLLSALDDAPDRERVVLQELGSYLEANSQVRILHLLPNTYKLTAHTQFIVLTPLGSQLDDPSVNSTSRHDCRLLLFSPESDIFPFDFRIQEHTSKDGLVCYYEDVDLFKLGSEDV